MANSKIEWTESTWNPLTGCTKISQGCQHCYAERMSLRLLAMGQEKYRNGFQLTLHESSLEEPLGWLKPQMIFVNSMSDLFHKDVPVEFILRVFDVMQKAHWHTFQVLTKRANRLAELNSLIDWPANVWMGVSIENNTYVDRANYLRQTAACVKFLSLEPLIGPLPDLNLDGINWVIAGGESGPGARPLQPEWVRDVRDLCEQSNAAFFFKQWGGVNKKKAGRLLDGLLWNQWPTADTCG